MPNLLTTPRRAARFVAVALCSMGAVTGTASADGGSSIAGATAVTFGQQHVGNTANGGKAANSSWFSAGCTFRSWWSMPVIAGDLITIDWESHSQSTNLILLPVGTTDFSRPSATALTTQSPSDTLKNEQLYTASVTGSLPFEFLDDGECSGARGVGPYSFTAYVRHAIVLGVARTPAIRRAGTLNVSVQTPDGAPITDPGITIALRAKSGTKTRTVGTATAANGVAAITFQLPRAWRGRRVYIQVKATGANYLTKASSVQRVRVR